MPPLHPPLQLARAVTVAAKPAGPNPASPPPIDPKLRELLLSGTDEDVLQRYASLAERAKDIRFGVLETEYVVLDTETTGFSPTRDSLIEVAAALVCGSEIIQRFSTFVNPGRAIPPGITELTGISDSDVESAPSAEEVLRQLQQFVGQRKIIAHNAEFDRGFIAQNSPPGSGLGDSDRWIDSLELARIALPRLREYKLQTLSNAFGTARSTHRAIDDVEALCGLWRIMLTAVSDFPPGLAALFAQMLPSTVWPLRELFAQVAGADGALESQRFSLAEARKLRELSQRSRQKADAQELDGGMLKHQPLDLGQLAQAFSDDGLLATMYGQFEPRAEQLRMAQEIADALDTYSHRVIEAGTGVGKSMAYLLPLILFAQRNQVVCGVATKTNALLDQLMYSELPRLDAALPDGVSYVALKGYDHYPCLRKLMGLARSDRACDSTAVPTLVATLLSFVCQSARADLDSMALPGWALPRFEVCASSDDCLRHKCRYYRQCLLHGARRAARKADVVITNHALLFCGLGENSTVLPPIRQWVIDEAHGMEAEARDQLSYSFESRALRQTLRSLAGSSGVLAAMRRKAEPLSGAALLLAKLNQLQEDASAVEAFADSAFTAVSGLCQLAEQSSYNRVELWINEQVRDSGQWGVLATAASSLITRLDKLWKSCRDLVTLSLEFDELLEPQGDLVGLATALKWSLEALSLIMDGSDRGYVYYAELDRGQSQGKGQSQGQGSQYDRLVASPIDIGEALCDRLYPEVMSLVYTSATLAIGDSFDYFARGVGLDRQDRDRWQAVRLQSSYDFQKNMAVYLPSDIPDPRDSGYRDALEQLICAVHTAMGGSSLTLFTNRRDMEEMYSRLKQPLAAVGITLRCQSHGFSARRLRDEFLENESLSLFALRSFWEGFDAPGDTLRCVIIPKLPFGKPNDPLMLERGLREQNAWRNYALPEAVIDLKQAAGRLIRSSSDRGVLVLADTRLLSKWYGRIFLKALPSQQRYTLDTAAIADALRQW
jgi:ATP-dependent DNA helicase DinG